MLSTGPYKVESFRPSDELVLVKNDQWDADTDPARHQYADKWVFKFNADPDQTDQIMLSDNAQSQTSLSTDLVASNYTEAQDKLGDRLVQQSQQCTSFLYPDYSKTDMAFRKALAYAYPYEDAWTAGGSLPGVTRTHATTIMPPGMAGKPDYYVDGEEISFDLDKAKEYLAESETDPTVTMIYYESDPLAVAAQDVITKGFEDAGFTVNAIGVTESPYATWLSPDDPTNKKLNVRGVAWCSDWPSALTFIPPLFRGDAAYDTGYFSEDDINSRIDEIPTLPQEEQADAWGSLDEQIMTDYFPAIPLANYNTLFTFGSKIGNPSGDEASGAPNYKNLYVMQ
ncbi:ABC transporter substrate-binding protein [Nocardioides bruguierae]|uniref:ABC transporter substrate-binding protein n=1 Tax=Nocardioides bruguierae TaxID=2945102 RepID=A0A9X2IG81_9ACTN|nr:ABC transporter substrate-binding protein [Nocardioides bruguierae]MCM0622102.1 ABC transporter substrate-binding protein [Nocardioides bruguierae]